MYQDIFIVVFMLYIMQGTQIELAEAPQFQVFLCMCGSARDTVLSVPGTVEGPPSNRVSCLVRQFMVAVVYTRDGIIAQHTIGPPYLPWLTVSDSNLLVSFIINLPVSFEITLLSILDF